MGNRIDHDMGMSSTGSRSRPLVETRMLGDLRIHALDAGMQRLDGGAMFGVVPKPLWERRIPADERNRIPLALRCLLVETPDALVLIDNGAGNKESDRFRDIYGIDNAPTGPDPRVYPTRLEQAIAAAGFASHDIDLVIDTHLHFDHAGGNTVREPDREGDRGGGAAESGGREDGQGTRIAFPRARYIVQRGEWEFAHLNNERIQASYLPHNFDPVHAAGRFDFVEGEVEITPGIVVQPTPGHTPHHQSVILRSRGETACYLADVVPTSAHLPLPWIMGYDLEPLITLETKRALLARARSEGWLLIFEHDPARAWGVLDPTSDRPALLAAE
ncbi:MAG: MBL fold metallo-hydrolase [Gemmatimonadetes bacterium]|nr:MBL fold metallo-hydrolase [Gemmatimonadota bacterium]